MGDLKFVPQSMLDLWADLGKIDLDGNNLTIAAEKVTFQLTPAVRFVSLLEGDDTHKLVAKVKAEAFVKEIGGEVMDDSCIVGETAYTVQPGFLAETEALAAAQKSKATRKPVPAAPPAPQPSPPQVPKQLVPAPTPPRKDDAELLTQFLLESLD